VLDPQAVRGKARQGRVPASWRSSRRPGPGAVFLGAAAWSLWMAFDIFCVLVGLWYYQQAHANRVSH